MEADPQRALIGVEVGPTPSDWRAWSALLLCILPS
jgi:hypothetical protein